MIKGVEMALSRKYYVMIAGIIKDNTIYSNNSTRRILKKDNLINDLSNMFMNDNSLFDCQRFEEACK